MIEYYSKLEEVDKRLEEISKWRERKIDRVLKKRKKQVDRIINKSGRMTADALKVLGKTIPQEVKEKNRGIR